MEDRFEMVEGAQSLFIALKEQVLSNKDTKTPLVSCICASNEYQEDREGLGSAYDLFQFRFCVDSISNMVF